ncbi:MAG: RNase adapter RapZ [Steroidobacteraceae bacterium]
MAGMRLIIVSGLSGSGKSVALHVLEDLGFYCIDNIPAALLKSFISHTVRSGNPAYERTAVGIDARNTGEEIGGLPTLVAELKRSGIGCEVLYLVASDQELLRRFTETRRRHPMSRDDLGLQEAIALERRLLEPMSYAADLVIDTSRMSVHELRDVVNGRIERRAPRGISLAFESFGYKNGIPGDANFVFDARTLPNPYWEPNLRLLTGRDTEVIKFLESHRSVGRLLDDITSFVAARIPEFTTNGYNYLTVAIGCTGGQHRSVYMVEQLVARFRTTHGRVIGRHSALGAAQLVTANESGSA